MRSVPVRAAGQIDTAVLAELTRIFADALTLADVLAKCRGLAPPATVAEIVTQDEYTHDVVVSYLSPRYFLSFDST